MCDKILSTLPAVCSLLVKKIVEEEVVRFVISAQQQCAIWDNCTHVEISVVILLNVLHQRILYLCICVIEQR